MVVSASAPPHLFRGSCRSKQDLLMQMGGGVPRDADMRDIFNDDTGGFETITDRLGREAGAMLEAIEALLFHGSDQFSILNDGGRSVAVICVDTEDVHGERLIKSPLCVFFLLPFFYPCDPHSYVADDSLADWIPSGTVKSSTRPALAETRNKTRPNHQELRLAESDSKKALRAERRCATRGCDLSKLDCQVQRQAVFLPLLLCNETANQTTAGATCDRRARAAHPDQRLPHPQQPGAHARQSDNSLRPYETTQSPEDRYRCAVFCHLCNTRIVRDNHQSKIQAPGPVILL